MEAKINSIEKLKIRLMLFVDWARDDTLSKVCSLNPGAYFSSSPNPEKRFIQTVFDPLYLSYEQFIDHMVFWVYKDYYMDSLPRKRMSELDIISKIPIDSDLDPDVIRKKLNRAIERMLERKHEDAKRLGYTTEYIDLVAKKEKRKGEKSKIYHLTDLDVKGISNYFQSASKVIQILEDGAVARSELGINGEDISDAYKQYLYLLRDENSFQDSRSWVESLINLSSIEAELFPAFLYEVAKYMEDQSKIAIPQALSILCSKVSSFYDAGWKGQSMFIHDRNRSIERFWGGRDASLSAEIQFYSLTKIQTLVRIKSRSDSAMKELLSQIDTEDARAYFSERYNLFSDCALSEWDKPKSWPSSLGKKYRKSVEVLTNQGFVRSVQLNAKNRRKSKSKDVPRSE